MAEIKLIKTNYAPSNTERLKQVATPKIRQKQKSFFERFVGDTGMSIINYVVHELLVPVAKNTLSDIVEDTKDMVIFGDVRGSRRRLDRNRSTSRVSYSSYYDRDREYEKKYQREDRKLPPTVTKYDFDQFTFERRADAEEVISQLVEMIERYGAATLINFYDLIGVGDEWPDSRYGWYNLSKAGVIQTRYGYILDLPKPVVLD